jgi:wobble nucleotide-excising tRNase
MITKIELEGVASYKSKVSIDELKKFNFFYGLNGTGKTTISNFLGLDNLNEEQASDFNKSKLYPTTVRDDFQIVVYNQNYIDRIFRENSHQPGIFSLGEKDVIAETIIEKAENKIEELEGDLEPINAVIKDIESDMKSSQKSLSEEIWKKEKPRKNTTSLEFCLKGHKKSAKLFFQEIRQTDISTEDEQVDFLDLEKEAEKLEEDQIVEKIIYELIPETHIHIEDKTIFNEPILNSSNSYLTELISKLDNGAWVREGIEKYLSQSDSCPFCQQEFVGQRKQDLLDLIDKTYKEKTNEIEDLKAQYEELKIVIDNLIETYQSDEELKSNSSIVEQSKILESHLKENLRQIEDKYRDPSQIVELKSTISSIDTINKTLKVINQKNSEFNSSITNKTTLKTHIKSHFWKGLKQKYSEKISAYDTLLSERKAKLTSKQKKQEKLKSDILEQEKIIRENRKKTTNTDRTIQFINDQIKNLGLEGFSIAPTDKNKYKIFRSADPEKKGVFKSLSEGEKTIITFLYFIQQCLGAENEEENPDFSKRIIAIDDPISSLSFPMVFDIANLVKEFFLYKESEFAQLFIFTHHLYFYHELIERYEGKKTFKNMKSYYRVSKNQTTVISKIDHGDFKNTYQSYWEILKEVKSGNGPVVALPNTMRNILEHFFSFINQEQKWSDTIKKLGDKNKSDTRYKTLLRYVDRQSHSDLTNVIDLADFDLDKFFKVFRDIFEESNHLEHYIIMSGEEAPANNNETNAVV